jgi:hypothetical protein
MVTRSPRPRSSTRPGSSSTSSIAVSGRICVEDVFVAAIECDVTARAQLVAERCGDDADLRREVESLLASHERPGLVDRLAPAIAPAAAWARTQVAGWEGRRVGQYSVLELVDAGGMGIVYKAHDARLGRHVALKFLPPHLSKQSSANNDSSSRREPRQPSIIQTSVRSSRSARPRTDSCSSPCRSTTARPWGRA